MKRNKKCLLSSALLTLMPMASVHAEQGNKPQEIENIVVTAQRTAENIQSTPVSITAFSSDSIEKFQIDNAKDISQVAPNVIIRPVTGGSAGISPYIRGGGVSDGANITSEAEVGVYIDDVYQPRSAASFIESLDIERIEVLRGPQGTLYGRNSSAGALKFITRLPGEELRFKNEAGFGSWNEKYDKLSVSGPLSEGGRLRGGFSGMMRERDGGRQYNTSLGKDVGEEKYKGFQADLYYVADTYTARLKGFYTDFDSDGLYASSVDPFSLSLPYDKMPYSSGKIDRVVSPYESYTSDEQFGVSLHLSKDINELMTLSSITSWNRLEDDWATGFSGGVAYSALGIPMDGYTELYQREALSDQESFTQELQLSGNSTSGFINYVAGLYYFHESGTQKISSSIFFTPSYTTFDVTTDSYAAFGQVSFNLTDALALTVGGRYTEDEKSIDALVANEIVDRDDTFSKFTPKLGLDYQASDELLFYASYTEGFKSGGYNSLASSAASLNLPFDMQEVNAYEIGTKTDWLDNRLRVNISGFFNEYSSLQQQSVTAEGVFITENYDAEHKGVELEVSVQASDSLFLWANGVYQNSEFTDTSVAGGSLLGNQMTNVFDYQFALGFDFSVDVGPGSLSLGANANRRDDFYSTADNAEIGHVEAVTLVDAYASYSYENWKVSLSGKNLTDEKYAFTGFGFSLVQPRFMADPMTWRLAVSYEL